MLYLTEDVFGVVGAEVKVKGIFITVTAPFCTRGVVASLIGVE